MQLGRALRMEGSLCVGHIYLDIPPKVLHMHKNSALEMLLQLKVNYLSPNVHYINQAYLHHLLFHVLDTLFDPAWLSLEIKYQWDPPSQYLIVKWDDPLFGIQGSIQLPLARLLVCTVFLDVSSLMSVFFLCLFLFDRSWNWLDLGP
jgi:hypothetical protein